MRFCHAHDTNFNYFFSDGVVRTLSQVLYIRLAMSEKVIKKDYIYHKKVVCLGIKYIGTKKFNQFPEKLVVRAELHGQNKKFHFTVDF